MAVAIPPPLVPIAGASDREGRSRRNRHHWIAPSRGISPIFLFLIIAARPRASSSIFVCLFQGVYWYAKVRSALHTAPGRRWEQSGACARAIPMGQGVGRVWQSPAPRVERAREPALTRDAGCRSASLVWTPAQLYYLTKRQQRNVDNETTCKTSSMKQRPAFCAPWARRVP